MSICQVCKKRVKVASGNKRKVHGVWVHKHNQKHKKKKLKLSHYQTWEGDKK